MNFPTWEELLKHFCSVRGSSLFYEDFSNRRYNFSPYNDRDKCRLIFLKDVLKNKENKTLQRKGRFIWCRKLTYEGRGHGGYRTISFSVDNGTKRFQVQENNVLCLPSTICVQNNRFFKSEAKTFLPFSTIFSYQPCLKMMAKNNHKDITDLLSIIKKESPFSPGTLVSPREGYFYPQLSGRAHKEDFLERPHPCGIILGPSLVENPYVDKEFYRVRFGDTTYERVHPVQMEIINEI